MQLLGFCITDKFPMACAFFTIATLGCVSVLTIFFLALAQIMRKTEIPNIDFLGVRIV